MSWFVLPYFDGITPYKIMIAFKKEDQLKDESSLSQMLPNSICISVLCKFVNLEGKVC